MRRHNVLQRSAATILAFVLVGPAWAAHDVVHRLANAWVVGHLVVNAAVQFHGLVGMQDVVIVRDDALECHGSVERADLSSPTSALPEVADPDDLHEFVVDFHVGPQHEEAALAGLVRFVRSGHVVISSEECIYSLHTALLLRPHHRHSVLCINGTRRSTNTTTIRTRNHHIEQRIHGLQYQNIQIQMHHHRMIDQRVRFQLDQLLFTTASILLNILTQKVTLDVLDGHRGVAFDERVSQIGQRFCAFLSIGMVDGVHLVIVLGIGFGILRRNEVDGMLEDGGTFRDGVLAASRDRDGVCDFGWLLVVIVVVVCVYDSNDINIGMFHFIWLFDYFLFFHNDSIPTIIMLMIQFLNFFFFIIMMMTLDDGWLP
mmetsp:Transcript_19324/g.54750  ORF Transcript_19324/g.54750 Transcript_19324/m.54750 type:complete len:372 (+) Transcript_19324:268-1383(+)